MNGFIIFWADWDDYIVKHSLIITEAYTNGFQAIIRKRQALFLQLVRASINSFLMY